MLALPSHALAGCHVPAMVSPGLLEPVLRLRGGVPEVAERKNGAHGEIASEVAFDAGGRWLVDRAAAQARSRPMKAHVVLALLFFSLNRLSIAAMTRFGVQSAQLREDAAASLVAVVHALPAALLAFTTLSRCGWQIFGPISKPELSARNSDHGFLGLVFTNCYFIQDMVYMLRFARDDVQVLVHHVLSFVFLTSAMVVGRGDMAAALCILIGEVTNPITNGYYIAKALHARGHMEQSTVRMFAVAQWASLFFVRFLYSPWALCLRISR
jgi:hypothetical protein